jgi:hypothetical protein
MDEDQLAMNREDSIPFHLRLLYYTVTEAKRQNELSSVRLPSVLYLWLSRRIFHSNMMLQYKQYLALSEDVEFRKETKVCQLFLIISLFLIIFNYFLLIMFSFYSYRYETGLNLK